MKIALLLCTVMSSYSNVCLCKTSLPEVCAFGNNLILLFQRKWMGELFPGTVMMSLSSLSLSLVSPYASQVISLLLFRKSDTSQVLCKSELSIHIVNYLCIYKGGQLKSRLQCAGIWLAVAWLPCCMCYCLAVFLWHLCLVVLSFPQKILVHISKMLF